MVLLQARRPGEMSDFPVQGWERCTHLPCEMAAHFAGSIRSLSPFCARLAGAKRGGTSVCRRRLWRLVCLCASVQRGKGASCTFNDIRLGGLLSDRELSEENGEALCINSKDMQYCCCLFGKERRRSPVPTGYENIPLLNWKFC